MLTALVEANADTLGTDSSHDRVIISSGYRNTEKQASFITIPSERKTKISWQSRDTVSIIPAMPLISTFLLWMKNMEMRENEQAWLEENCAKYGFVIRYEGSKFEITGILMNHGISAMSASLTRPI